MPNFSRPTELAGIAEYVQLEWTVLDNPLSSDASYIRSINAALSSDDRFIVSRPASSVVRGASTFGIGYGAVEAVIRTTGLANNISYDVILSRLDNPALGVNLVDWNYVDNSNDTQFQNGAIPPMPATGGAPSPLQARVNSDPISNAIKPIVDAASAGGKAAVATVSTVATIVEIALVAAALIAVAWAVSEYKRK